MRAASLSLVFAALAGCGTGLYDAAGLPDVETPGLTCDSGQIVCGGVCTVESATQCGASCQDCTAGAIPADAAGACLAGGSCGYACQDGYLKCAGGCCATATVTPPRQALAAGAAFSCALLDDETVHCWGANGSGQVGDGGTERRTTPVQVPLVGAISVGAGERHGCAVLTGGAVACWGANEAGQATGTSASAIVAAPAITVVSSGADSVVGGAAHTCALVGGAVKCWGSNASGQLGGMPVSGVATPVVSGATALSAGANHTCAVVGGAVKCWGANGSGQLGDGTTTTPATGTTVTAIASSGVTLVAAAANQTCASSGLSNNSGIDDVVRCWGSGLGATFLFSPQQITPAVPMKDATHSTLSADVSRLVAGRQHVCVERKTEAVDCFGADNARGQLGWTPNGPSESATVPLPVTVPAVVALAAGADHSCAALANGRLRCWGANAEGQLGNGTITDPGVGILAIPSGR